MKTLQAPSENIELTGWIGEILDWQNGNLAIIDNMGRMHGCAPFTGTRRVLAAMGQPQSTPSQTPIFG